MGFRRAMMMASNYVRSVIQNFTIRTSNLNAEYEEDYCLERNLDDLNKKDLLYNTSLVITPNSYNERFLYATLPNTSLGNISFTRNTFAQRMNSLGIIETVPSENLLISSATFPTQNVNVNSGGTYTLSFYGTGSTSLTGSYIGSLSGTGVSDRVSLTFTVSVSGTLTLTKSGTVTLGQLTQTSTIQPYFPTTNRLNIPRLNYQQINRPRTNVFAYSEPISGDTGVPADTGLIVYSAHTWGINNFETCIKYDYTGSTNTSRYGKSLLTFQGITYVLSAYILMDDNTEPQIGTGATADFAVVLAGNPITSLVLKENVYSNVWRIAYQVNLGRSSLSNNGIVKYTTNSPKGFRTTGWQLEAYGKLTSYIKTNGVYFSKSSELSELTTCPTLLLEPLATNNITYSENFSQWSNENSPIITSNVSTSPDGAMSADTIQSNSVVNYQTIYQTIPITSTTGSTIVSYSIFVKKEQSPETNYGGIGLDFSASTGILRKEAWVIIDAYNGTVTPSITIPDSPATGLTINEIIIQDFVTYWRVGMVATDYGSNSILTSPALTCRYYSTLSTDGVSNSPGTGSTRTIWGAQLELTYTTFGGLGSNAIPTSYIPTTGSTSTRVADTLTINNVTTNNMMISDVGGTYGTFYVENNTFTPVPITSTPSFAGNSQVNLIFFQSSGGTTTYIRMRQSTSFYPEMISSPATSSYTFALGGGTLAYDYNKTVLSINGNKVKMFQNGVQFLNTSGGTEVLMTSGGTPNLDKIVITPGRNGASIKKMALYNTVLPDSDCLNLSTI